MVVRKFKLSFLFIIFVILSEYSYTADYSYLFNLTSVYLTSNYSFNPSLLFLFGFQNNPFIPQNNILPQNVIPVDSIPQKLNNQFNTNFPALPIDTTNIKLDPNLNKKPILPADSTLKSDSIKPQRVNNKDWLKEMKEKFSDYRTPYVYRYSSSKLIDKKARRLPIDVTIKPEVNDNVDSVTINTYFYGLDVFYPYKMSLDDYIETKKRVAQKTYWDSLVGNYDLKKALAGGDLARMISAATGLTIPIPPNPLMGIFGKPEININVSGEVNLRLGWRWDSQNLGTVSAFGQTQSSPIFNQDIRVNVNGRIGDKLKIGTDWNTRSQFEYKNLFKVGYEGEDDEIIKLVEVGNVSLPIQSTLIGGGQALFGVRADFQFGPLFLKTLVSQKRGERRFVDAQGGASKQSFSLRAYDFAKNHFFIDEVYKKIYNEYFKNSTPILPSSRLANYHRIKQIEVWESQNDIAAGALSSEAIAVDTLPPRKLRKIDPNTGTFYNYNDFKNISIKAGQVERGKFQRLDSMRYKIDYNLGTLSILNLRQDRTYAIAYVISSDSTNFSQDSTNNDYYGNMSYGVGTKDTLVLKLIYRPNMQPGFKTLWSRMMKNVYSINATNVNMNDTRIGVYYLNQNNDSSDVLPGAPDKLVTIFKVDQVNNSTGNPPHDGQFDLRPPYFNPVTGEIIFPSVEPFREGLRNYFNSIGQAQLAEQYIYPDVYDTTLEAARRNTARDRFIISGEVSGRATNRIQLGAFNLAPNSVRVTLDGVQLKEYEDYQIDYFSGTLTLKNYRAMLPNANLRIEYEQNDVFNIATKTLLGLRGDLQIYKTRRFDSYIGFTAMYYDQSAIMDRVRLGEEPVSNTMLGIDGRVNWDMPFFTRLLNYLPFYDTKAPSSLIAKGELAMILPEPNKRKSEVASDNQSPVVYIDDFEGAQRYISLGLSPTLWYHSSAPEDFDIESEDSIRDNFRGKNYWFQYFIPRVPIREVYPKKSVLQGRSNISPLTIVFDPYRRGIYNKNPEFRDSINPEFKPDSAKMFFDKNKPKIWGGIMRLLSSFNTNFDAENIEYIEVMMRIGYYEPGASKLYIDLGQISEDVIANKRLNTEDGITAANPVPNGIIDAGEDVGLDQISDDDEKNPNNMPWPLYLEPDPSKDNYQFDFVKDDQLRSPKDFENFNNYEKNSVAELGQFPDTEILNKNNGQTISLDNSYFSYELQLDPNPLTNSQIVGGGDNGWFLYRIPIRKPTSKVGNPLYSNIQYVRVWYKGGPLVAEIADWRLVGSHWQKNSNLQSTSPADSSLEVAFVNVEENSGPPDYYTMPPGVEAPRQLQNTDAYQDIRLNEQSLSLRVKNLRYSDERMAVRFFRPLDIFFYKELKFFIHGDGSMPDYISIGSTPKAYAFLRFGIDSNNYYEYRRPITRGWQDIKIILAQLTAIKQVRDSLGQYQRQIFPVPGDPLAYFAIKGNPVLTRVQFFGIGIANPAERFPNELTTTMWIDELRLINPEARNDWGAVGNVEFKMADLAIINASVQHTKPNFHRLEERFGNRISSSNWSFAVQGNLEKFTNKFFKEMKLPISYTHTEYLQDPEYVANNDIKLEEAAESVRQKAISDGKTITEANKLYNDTKMKSQTVKVQDSWAMQGVKLGIPIDHWSIKETINKINFGYSYSQEFERSPVVQEKFSWIWQLNSSYSLSIPEIAVVKPYGWMKSIPLLSAYSDFKLNFLPSNINTSVNMQRRRTTEQSRFLEFPSPVIRDFSATRTAQLNWKFSENGLISPTIDYNLSTISTLVPFELDEFGKQRTGAEIASHIFFNNGKFIELGDNSLHNQSVTINFKPKLPLGNYSKHWELSGNYNVNYVWQDQLQKDPSIKDIAKYAAWNNSFRISNGFRMKQFFDDLFGLQSSTPLPPFMQNPNDTNRRASTSSSSSGSLVGNVFSSIGSVLKTIFIDYERFDIIFNQSGSSTNPGVYGNTGITNFWGRGLTFRESTLENGPSFAYQLGLVPDPHGSWSFAPSSRFPFFSFNTNTGIRPINAILQDNFTQRNTLEMKTNRTLWPGATLDLNWKTELGYSKAQTVSTDNFGNQRYTNILAQESLTKNFLSFSSIFGINVFNNTLENVVNIFSQKAKDSVKVSDPVKKNEFLMNAMSESFIEGLEAFSIFSGKIGKFLPAVNWSLRWEGIEKLPFLKGFAKRISLEHSYTSKYTETVQTTDVGKVIQGQQIQHGYSPLIGINMAFDENKFDGILTGTVRYITNVGYSISASNRSTISMQTTDEIQINGSYTMKGFDFPLLGIILKNDLEVSFLGSFKKNRQATFDIEKVTDEKGRTLNGNTQITIEPRVRYSMSQRVSASFFIRYEGTFTEGAAQPGYNTTQVGLDLRISIAGGR